MLQWIWCRERKRGAASAVSLEVKVACLRLREGGGWQECIEIGGASTGGITNVNLKWAQEINSCKFQKVVLYPGFNGNLSRKKGDHVIYLSVMSLSCSSLSSMLWMAFLTAAHWNQWLFLFGHCEYRQLLWPERPQHLREVWAAGSGHGPGRKVRKSKTSRPYTGFAPQWRSLTPKM